ncbi:DNA-3-methyladenine glycosylase 2 family protein [Candidatus Saccharibacteria bacterium]|jgi:DNA-3-methyladenine glycosylase II|nr:DNA-3-methyladenine glycosylase 2 family protein [Candidatus Saccharibacteria bacterium]
MNDAILHLSKDPTLFKVLARYPQPDFERHTNYYQELVESIISQQLSVKAAATIVKRFRALFAEEFPTPQQILALSIDELRAAGLSRQKASYMRDLATKILDKTIVFDALDEASNQEIIDELTKVNGIGEWTVHMFLMFCMARPDVLAYGDLGIRNGVTKLYGLKTLATTEDVKRIALENNWHPYESVACWYVWQSLDNKPSVY